MRETRASRAEVPFYGIRGHTRLQHDMSIWLEPTSRCALGHSEMTWL